MITVTRKTGMVIASFILAITTQTALANDGVVTIIPQNGAHKIIVSKDAPYQPKSANKAQVKTSQELVEAKPEELFLPAVYAVDNAWNSQSYDFTKTVPEPIVTPDADYAYETPVGLDELSAAYGGGKEVKSDGEELVDSLMNRIPYKKSLKHTWKFIDGDVDVAGVNNLRVNRRNKGLRYKTNHIPLIGEVEGTELRADAGEDTKLTMTSDRLPFTGRVDGMTFKASVGNDDSKVSLRYHKEIAIELNKTHEYQSASQ